MISSRISRASAGLLLMGAVALLFAPDVILPYLILGFPLTGIWLGQLLAAALLALAVLNWLSRSALLGGIYGRPVLLSNGAFYFITAMVLLNPLMHGESAPALWLLFFVATLLAGVYGWLLVRGPMERDLRGYSGVQPAEP